MAFETLRAFKCLQNIKEAEDDHKYMGTTGFHYEISIESEVINGSKSVMVTSITSELEDFDMSKKKRIKKTKKLVIEKPVESSEDDYDYRDLLKKCYLQMPVKTQERKKMPAINLIRIGSKRTRIINFQELCTSINRTEQHVNTFFSIELGTLTSLGTPNNHLTIRGILNNKQVEDLMLSYMKQYVRCDQCKDWDTIFLRENEVTFICCNECTARRTLPVMKRGFQAKTTFSN